jgi:hypothetical protein
MDPVRRTVPQAMPAAAPNQRADSAEEDVTLCPEDRGDATVAAPRWQTHCAGTATAATGRQSPSIATTLL